MEDYDRLIEFSPNEETAETVRQLKKLGSQRKVAKKLGVAQSTVSERIRKARELADTGGLDEKKVVREQKDRVKGLQEIVQKQADVISGLRKKGVRIPEGRPRKRKGKGFVRFCIPDTHGCAVDMDALNAMFADMERIQPAEVIMLGDHLECGGFLAEHHTLGYVAQTEYTFVDDVCATNEFLDRVEKYAPGSEKDYILGNHEQRIEKWIVDKSVKNKADGKFLHDMFCVDSLLSLEKRGIREVKQGVRYDNLPIPATVKRGSCHFTHGISTAKHAAAVHVSKFGGNVVYGHTHRADSYTIRTVTQGVIGGWSPGCLCELQPLWRHTSYTDWSHGYGVQIVHEDGSFLHLNVPIIDGVSYMGTFLEAAS